LVKTATDRFLPGRVAYSTDAYGSAHTIRVAQQCLEKEQWRSISPDANSL